LHTSRWQQKDNIGVSYSLCTQTLRKSYVKSREPR